MTQLKIDVTKFFQGSGNVGKTTTGIDAAQANVSKAVNELQHFWRGEKWYWASGADHAYWGGRAMRAEWAEAVTLAEDVLAVAKFLPKGLESDAIVQLFERANQSAKKSNQGFAKLENVFTSLKNLNLVHNADIKEYIATGHTYSRSVRTINWAELALTGRKPRWLRDFSTSWVVRTDQVIRHLQKSVIPGTDKHPIRIGIDNDRNLLPIFGDTAVREKAEGKRFFDVSLVDGKFVFTETDPDPLDVYHFVFQD